MTISMRIISCNRSDHNTTLDEVITTLIQLNFVYEQFSYLSIVQKMICQTINWMKKVIKKVN
jgi:hypothetical protein